MDTPTLKKAFVRWLTYMSAKLRVALTPNRINAMAALVEARGYVRPNTLRNWATDKFGEQETEMAADLALRDLRYQLRVCIRTPHGYLPIMREDGEPMFTAYVDNAPEGKEAYYLEPSDDVIRIVKAFAYKNNITLRSFQLRLNGTWTGDEPSGAFCVHPFNPNNPRRRFQEPPSHLILNIEPEHL